MSINSRNPKKGDLIILPEGTFFESWPFTIDTLGVLIEDVIDANNKAHFYELPPINTMGSLSPSKFRMAIALFADKIYAISFFEGDVKIGTWS